MNARLVRKMARTFGARLASEVPRSALDPGEYWSGRFAFEPGYQFVICGVSPIRECLRRDRQLAIVSITSSTAIVRAIPRISPRNHPSFANACSS